MEIYTDINHDSGVAAFKIGLDIMLVQFKNGSICEYTSISAGKANLEEMARLARSGDGLNSFINRVVKNGYSRKIR